MFLNRLLRVMGTVVKLFPIGNLTLSIQGSFMIPMGIKTFEILVLRPISMRIAVERREVLRRFCASLKISEGQILTL